MDGRDRQQQSAGRGPFWWFRAGMLAGVLFTVIRRPVAAVGCGCFALVIVLVAGGGLLLTYPGPVVVAAACLFGLIMWLRQRSKPG